VFLFGWFNFKGYHLSIISLGSLVGGAILLSKVLRKGLDAFIILSGLKIWKHTDSLYGGAQSGRQMYPFMPCWSLDTEQTPLPLSAARMDLLS
jgi:hypothetical protein